MNFKYTIVGLPRSRTYWFSKLLTFGDNHCFHGYGCYQYPIPLRKTLGNSTFLPWEEHTGKLVIIERDAKEAKKSLIRFAKEPMANIDLLFEVAEEGLEKLEGLRIPFEDIDKRLDEILDYIGVQVPQERIEEYTTRVLNSPDTSEDNSKYNYATF